MEKYELSFWEWDQFFRDLDVVIIGSGIVGLSTAIQLKEMAPKLSVTVVDRGTLPLGATTRNAGFACFGSLTELIADLEHHTREEVLELVAMRYQGLVRLRERYGDQALGYQSVGGYELFGAKEEERFVECCGVLETFNDELGRFIPSSENWPGGRGEDVFRVVDDELPSMELQGVKHLILNRAEGQIDTGRLLRCLQRRASELAIPRLYGLSIRDVQGISDGVELVTEAGWSFQAARVVVATNGFAQQLLPDLPIVPARNQVLITEPIPNLHLCGTFHYDQGYVYFRNVGDRLLLGGGRNQAPQEEETAVFGAHDGVRQYLLQLLRTQILPTTDFTIDRWWSGILGVGPQKRPIVQHIAPNILLAVRLGGMGVAIGTLVGEQAARELVKTL